MISDERLRRKERILKTQEFRKVYKKGLSAKHKAVILYSLPNNLGYSRVGFSISSKIVRSARIRNKTRRIFKEIYRKSKSKIKDGCDFVFIVKTDFAGKVTYAELERIFFNLTNFTGHKKT